MSSLPVVKGHASYLIEGTPRLTINHDVVAELDSSNAFEGTEIMDCSMSRWFDAFANCQIWIQDPKSSLKFGLPLAQTAFLAALLQKA